MLQELAGLGDRFYPLVDKVSGLIWGGTWGDAQVVAVPPMALLLLGAGVFFMLALKGRPFLRLLPAFGLLWRGRKASGAGEITPWQALSTALSGQIGTGNLAGVATAITLGGPGAIFWMWMTALVGMASAFAEAALAVRFRERHKDGRLHGGPMYYIRNGLGPHWAWLGGLFAICAMLYGLIAAAMVQSNTIAEAVADAAHPFVAHLPAALVETDTRGPELANWLPGLVLALLTFTVIIGGVKSIGAVAGRVVPLMAVGYVGVSVYVLALNADHIPAAFAAIFRHAFGLEQAVGGAAGYSVLAAIRYGVARGLFSNEAGQGSAPIAHAAAQTDDPVRQGEIAMLGVFIDTLIVCTMTALVVLVVEGAFQSGGGTVAYAWQSTSLRGIEVTAAAFGEAVPGGRWIVTVALFFFAFTTVIGWAYYGEQAAGYLLGDWAQRPFRLLWVGAVFLGAMQQVDFVWKLADIMGAAMALPNLVAIIALSGVVVAMAREADRRRRVIG